MSNELRIDSPDNQWGHRGVLSVLDAHTIVSVTDLDGLIIDANERFCGLMGYSRLELIGQDLRIFSSGYHSDTFWSDVWSQIQEGNPWTGEVRNRTKDGDIVWFKLTIVPTVDDKGAAWQYVLLCSDITSFKNRELELERGSEVFKKMSEVARIGAWDVDLVEGTLFWSSVTKDIHEVEPDFVPDLDMAIEFYKEGEDRDRISEKIGRSMSEGCSWDVELRIVTQRGREVWVRAIGKSEMVDGACVRIYGTFQDIDEQKRSRESLAEHVSALELAKNRLDLAVRAGGIGIWEWDFESDSIEWDERMFDLYGIEEVGFGNRSKDWFACVHENDRTRTEAAFGTAFSRGKDLDSAFRIVWKDGSVHHMRILAVVQHDDLGNAIRVVGTNREVTTEICKNEALVELARKAKIATEVRGEFIANMSHEIRTPLNGVIGMASLLLDSGSLDREQRECTETIAACGDSLLTIVNDVLDFSKASVGTLEQDCVDFDLRDLLNDYVSKLIVQSRERGLAVRCKVDADVPSHFRGDEGRLRQILTNLESNSTKFTFDGGIYIFASLESSNKAECVIKFIVRDTGIGVAEEDQATIFDGFTQVDASTTRNYGGMGLGLAISKQLAELMGGAMGMESVERNGSEFWFTVRLGRQDEVVFSKGEMDRVGSAQILLASSGPESVNELEGMLSRFGSSLVFATSGIETMEKMKATQSSGGFDLAIVEHDLLDEEGHLVVETIRSDPSFSGMRLVVLSKVGDYGIDEQLEHHDIHTYLTTPIRESDLRERVVSALAPKETENEFFDQNLKDRFEGAAFRILLAEDSPINQFIMKRLLKRIGLNADVAANGLEVLKSLDTIPYDFILMDVQMPEMDGLEATRRIRQSDESCGYRDIPIVALTARTQIEDRMLCLESGMNDHLSKPITVSKLAAILDEWVPSE